MFGDITFVSPKQYANQLMQGMLQIRVVQHLYRFILIDGS